MHSVKPTARQFEKIRELEQLNYRLERMINELKDPIAQVIFNNRSDLAPGAWCCAVQPRLVSSWSVVDGIVSFEWWCGDEFDPCRDSGDLFKVDFVELCQLLAGV